VLDAYDALVRQYANSCRSAVVSDRRLCQVLKLVQAAYVAEEFGKADGPSGALTEAHLVAASFGLCVTGDVAQADAFSNAYEKVVGERLAEVAMASKLSKLQRIVLDLESDYDADMSEVDAVDMYKKVVRYSSALDGAASDPAITGASNRELVSKLAVKLGSLSIALSPVVTASIRRDVESECKV
jgi:hypothetical protein